MGKMTDGLREQQEEHQMLAAEMCMEQKRRRTARGRQRRYTVVGMRGFPHLHAADGGRGEQMVSCGGGMAAAMYDAIIDGRRAVVRGEAVQQRSGRRDTMGKLIVQGGDDVLATAGTARDVWPYVGAVCM